MQTRQVYILAVSECGVVGEREVCVCVCVCVSLSLSLSSLSLSLSLSVCVLFSLSLALVCVCVFLSLCVCVVCVPHACMCVRMRACVRVCVFTPSRFTDLLRFSHAHIHLHDLRREKVKAQDFHIQQNERKHS